MHASIINVTLPPVKPGWSRWEPAQRNATWSRSNNSSPRPSGSQPGWEREREGERGPAAGSWNNTRPNARQPRATRSDFSSSVGFSAWSRAAMLPVISHVTEHQSNGTDGALAPAEADLQTLAGNTITQPPRPSSPLRLQERGERGGGGGWGGRNGVVVLVLVGRVDTENSV